MGFSDVDTPESVFITSTGQGNVYLHIRKGIKSIASSMIFGEEEIMKGGRVRGSSALAKTYCWVLHIKKDLYNSKIKD